MLDIALFRDTKTREEIRESEKNRFKDESVVDLIYSLDQEKIKAQYQLDQINKEVKHINSKIQGANEEGKKENKDVSDTIKELRDMKISPETKQSELRKHVQTLSEKLDKLISGVGNILDKSVPICKTDDGNVIVRTHEGFRKRQEDTPFHADIMKNFINAEAGAAAFGHRGYFLQGRLALLARALKNYAIDFLAKKEYVLVQPPVMMKKEVMGKTSQLSDFDEQLYKVEDGLYLIATSEQPLTALHMGKRLPANELPKLYVGDSLCFRKEAGAYGKDCAGIFRVHQFEKIEQFVICDPKESEKFHEILVRQSEEFYQSLGFSYQLVLISSGEMNDASSKKYDLEAWFPHSKKYRELVSASNCTDYQSRNLNVKLGYAKQDEKSSYVHMLNSTMCAVQRTVCCLVENYYEDGKIIVPEVLRKYVDFDAIEL